MSDQLLSSDKLYVAIIGMAGRFPGARNIEEFWRNLRNGVESISFFSDQELLASGISPEVISNPSYVKARGILDDVEMFDADFFGFSPREAKIMDPQHRFFLECSYEALENGGYDADRYEGSIAVYAGVSMNNYLINIYSNPGLVESVGDFQIAMGTDKDFLTTRASYKLNLRGPSLTVQTACSTSLVAVDLACQSLLAYQSDMALAGGVSISVPQKAGYFYQEGGINSPDGHCRAFDRKAQGTVGGNGVGVVMLKRLPDAISDGDNIHAIIKGSAINNDGSNKVGYTAPSIDGQAEVIAAAQAAAGVEAGTIGYIEAHGTGTALGDPVEVAALTQAFSASTSRKQFCALGSVKTNIGHLDAAAGIAGLIKAVLVVKHGEIPASLHYREANPEIEFGESPFYVSERLRQWGGGRDKRRAGVSSFGIGGTNAHVVIEEWGRQEADEAEPETESEARVEAVLVSARSQGALEETSRRLSRHLEERRGVRLEDVAYTLQIGRKAYEHRRVALATTIEEAVSGLRGEATSSAYTCRKQGERAGVVFMFPGQGSQYVNMGLGLYKRDEEFRRRMDECARIVEQEGVGEILKWIYPEAGQEEESRARLRETAVTQPALYMVEYALARTVMGWGVEPRGMIGHSIGEYVAATLAGVLGMEEAIRLVVGRGRLMQEMEAGAMLSVRGSREEVEEKIEGRGLSIAADNGPRQCVVSGGLTEIEEMEEELRRKGERVERLETSHGYHSGQVDEAARRYIEEVRKVKIGEVRRGYISNVTGGWVRGEEVKEAEYWGRQMRQEVRFREGMEELLREEGGVYVEVGPGRVMSSLARQQRGWGRGREAVSLMRHAQEEMSDEEEMMRGIGRMWASGVEIEWERVRGGGRRRRVELPTYPFEGRRHWIDAKPGRMIAPAEDLMRRESGWLYVPVWKQRVEAVANRESSNTDGRWLLFVENKGFGKDLARSLKQRKQEVIQVEPGPEFSKIEEGIYTINPNSREAYNSLMKELRQTGGVPKHIIHLWCAESAPMNDCDVRQSAQPEIVKGFYSLLLIAQELGEEEISNQFELLVVVSSAQDVLGEESIRPERSLLIGPCKVIAQEYANIRCRIVDLVTDKVENSIEAAGRLIAEAQSSGNDEEVAYRGKRAWVKSYERIDVEKRGDEDEPIRERGVYLITGGAGGIGLRLGEYFGVSRKAKVVLVDRKWKGNGNPERGNIGAAVRAIEEGGGEVMIAGADVCCMEEMEAVIAQVRERFGIINGVIHCAGNIAGGIIQLKRREMADDILAPKVFGTRVLETLLADSELDFFALYSSLDSVVGVLGQVDYTAANAFLDSFAFYNTKKNGTYTVSINWGTWRDVGMAVEAEIPDDLKRDQQEKLSHGIDSAEGIDIFLRILSSKLGPQVIVSPVDLHSTIRQSKSLRPSLVLNEIQGGNAITPGDRAGRRSDVGFDSWVKGKQKAALHPLIDEQVVSPLLNGIAFQKCFTHQDVIITDHQVEGRTILPAAGFLEMALASAKQHFKQSVLELSNMVLLAPLEVSPGCDVVAQVLLKSDGSSEGLSFQIMSRSDEAGAWVENSAGTMVPARQTAEPERFDLSAIQVRCPSRIESAEFYSLNAECGPYFRSMEWLQTNGREVIARLRLPASARAASDYILHPSLIDGSIQSLQALLFASRMNEQPLGLFLPIEIESVRVSEALPDSICVYGTRVEADERSDGANETFRADLKLLNLQGQVLAELGGVTLKRISTASKLFASGADSANRRFVAPRNEIERRVAEIWRELLDVESVSADDNFFDLGGHSLLAIQLLSRLVKEFQLKLSMQSIFESLTVAEMALLIEQKQNAQSDQGTPHQPVIRQNYKDVDQLFDSLNHKSEDR